MIAVELEPRRSQALELSRGLDPTPENIARVARQTGDEAARWAFLQWDLRKRARGKFTLAERMLFDREGLEMASHERLAAFHACLFAKGTLVADLTCGVGADLIALCRRGPAIGFEVRDERTVTARYNLAAHGLSAPVETADCLAASWTFDQAFADPSRRSQGRRTSDPERFSPPLGALVERMAGLELGVIKLSPMLPDGLLRSIGASVGFVSFEGECREAVVKLGLAAEPELPYAVQLESGLRLVSGDPPVVAEACPKGLLFEADPAAIRAHALGPLCRALGVAPVADSNGFLSAPEACPDHPCLAWVRAFRVLATGHADRRRIQSDLRRLEARVTDVKVRIAKEDAASWRKSLSPSGRRPVLLALYPAGRGLRYAIVDPECTLRRESG